MNEIAFADELAELIRSALHDGPDMLAFVGMSFAQDTMITKLEPFPVPPVVGRQRLEITTRRGDVFIVSVDRVRVGQSALAEEVTRP